MFLGSVPRVQGAFSSATMNTLKTLLWRSPVINNQALAVRGLKTTRMNLDGTQPKINATHRVDKLEKRFLVWTGRFKRIEDVPQLVPPDMMERSRNIMRIRIANIMMALTLVGCLVMVWSGKKARQRGETLERQNYLWHKQIQEEEEAKKRAAEGKQ